MSKITMIMAGWLALFSLGCSQYSETESKGDPKGDVEMSDVENSYELKVGAGKIITELNVMLYFDSLLSDSRCPANVECVWEGNAEVSLVLLSDEVGERFTLNTSSQTGPTSFIFNGYNFSISRLNPRPHTDSSYNRDDYLLTVRIEKM